MSDIEKYMDIIPAQCKTEQEKATAFILIKGFEQGLENNVKHMKLLTLEELPTLKSIIDEVYKERMLAIWSEKELGFDSIGVSIFPTFENSETYKVNVTDDAKKILVERYGKKDEE